MASGTLHSSTMKTPQENTRPLLISWRKLVTIGVSFEPFSVSSPQLLMARKSVMGWPSGTSKDSEDTLRFAAANGVGPMIETFPLERAVDACERMMSGKVRFRSVLKI